MKKFTNKFLAVILMAAGVSFSFAQVRIVNSSTNPAAPGSSAFIDASSNTATNSTTNIGKGLLFPRTDLSTFAAFGLSGTSGIPNNYPSRFDGMIVYNTATGGVAGVGSTQGTLSPGFWYYDNKSTTNTGGTWRPLGGGADPKFNVTNDPAGTATNTLVDGAQVYAIRGQFTTTGTSTAVTITPPAGITSLYGITIFKTTGTGNKVVYARNLYSYDSTTGAAITGSPNMSVVYPADTYDYVLEYLK